jgi:DNA helicase-2/ATP-dependent DNA helicase PcrA
MDFDDILFNTNILFRDHPDVLEKYQHKFRYILVDEYQDTNLSQYYIINQLAKGHKNLCVVGDDAQSIYSFRGAKIENILNFKKDYPDFRLYKLERNYRSTKTIVEAANNLIANNKEQISKSVYSERDQGEKIKVIAAYTDGEEGALVAGEIKDISLTKQAKYSEFAILYRTNAQSRIFEESLRKLNIPYRIYGGISFYQRKEIKDMVAYFRLIVNSQDDEALRRIINYPVRGIGKTTLARLDEMAFAGNKSLWEVLTGRELAESGFNSGTLQKLRGFTSFIQKHAETANNKDAYECAYQIAVESGILKSLHEEKTTESISKYENLQELLNAIRQFTEETGEDHLVALPAFLENIALLTDQDTDKTEHQPRVTLMTIHAAKGLEFTYVFTTGLEEGLFPSARSAASQSELEEERRLFYVALTRAGDRAFLSYARSRYKWGTPEFCTPSRFLKEIKDEHLEKGDAGYQHFQKADSIFLQGNRSRRTQGKIAHTEPEVVKPAESYKRLTKIVTRETPEKNLSEKEQNSGRKSGIAAGMKVYHDRFGNGKVLQVEGVPPNEKAIVFFEGHGNKQLLLKFANLTITG